MSVKISNLLRLEDDLRGYKPTHVLSMLAPDVLGSRVPVFDSNVSVCQLFFYDDDDLDKQKEPVMSFVDQIIKFFGLILKSRSEFRLLIHCHAGASRSPAAAFIFYLLKYGKGREKQAFYKMMSITNKPWPNLYLVKLAQNALDLNECCYGFIENYQRENPRRYDAYQVLNRKRKL